MQNELVGEEFNEPCESHIEKEYVNCNEVSKRAERRIDDEKHVDAELKTKQCARSSLQNKVFVVAYPESPAERVALKEGIVIPPKKSVLVNVCGEKSLMNDAVMYRANDFSNAAKKHNIEVRSNFVIFQNNESKLEIFNAGTRKKRLPAGMIVAKCEEVYEDYYKLADVDAAQKTRKVPFGENSLEFGTEMNDDQVSQMLDLLHKYESRIAFSNKNLGRCKDVEFKILLTDDKPVKLNPYKYSLAMRQELQRQITEMIELGVASPTISEYSSPVVMVKKADGEYRMCVDLREINKKIKSDNYPLPHINDILHALNGACWFCVFDMNAGYWQIPIRKSDRHFLAFITQDTLCHFNLLPFGLKSAPTFFQRVMDYVLSGLKWAIVVVYLDDLVVMGHDFDALINNTGSVLQRFADFGLTIKASKCKFGVTSVTFLGHVISQTGIMMDRNKVSAILKMEPPTTRKDIRVFLGKVGFYGRFHKNLQVIAQPLTRRLRKDIDMGWGIEEQNAFEKIIRNLAQYPILRHFDAKLTIEMRIDACGIG
ncbi:Transposon Ty3-G Gag-Pol polyprotein-like protein, partial [Leptotrombidium deliense]